MHLQHHPKSLLQHYPRKLHHLLIRYSKLRNLLLGWADNHLHSLQYRLLCERYFKYMSSLHNLLHFLHKYNLQRLHFINLHNLRHKLRLRQPILSQHNLNSHYLRVLFAIPAPLHNLHQYLRFSFVLSMREWVLPRYRCLHSMHSQLRKLQHNYYL